MTNEITFDGLTGLGFIADTVLLVTMTSAAVTAVSAADAVVAVKLVKIVGEAPA